MTDFLDILFDAENCEPIMLMGEDGKILEFEQVAVIPYAVAPGDYRLYCVLKPIDRIEGVADDEAIVFRVEAGEDGCVTLCIEKDEDIAVSVFDKYYDLLAYGENG